VLLQETLWFENDEHDRHRTVACEDHLTVAAHGGMGFGAELWACSARLTI
jgi:hypothetical protein